MCGRFSLGATIRVGQLFDLPDWPETPPRYNIAPSQRVPAVIQNRETGGREFRSFRWGLVPYWAEDPAVGYRTINARSNTAATKPAFRRSFRERRCLIVADGFYEWKKEGRHKQPFHIRMRDGRPFAFAGLWEHWERAEGKAIDSCTILTAVPNELLRGLHHRMAVILPASEYDLWLDPSIQEVERLQPLLRPFPAEEMTAYPVSTVVNNPRNETPSCIEPLRQG